MKRYYVKFSTKDEDIIEKIENSIIVSYDNDKYLISEDESKNPFVFIFYGPDDDDGSLEGLIDGIAQDNELKYSIKTKLLNSSEFEKIKDKYGIE